jgi:hypothetical protein
MKARHLVPLLVLLAAPALAGQQPFRRGPNCDGTVVPPAQYQLDRTEVVSWCPDADMIASAQLLVKFDALCHWNDGATGSDVSITSVDNGVELWPLPGDTDCGPAVIGACSTGKVYDGSLITATQNLASDQTKLVCRARSAPWGR